MRSIITIIIIAVSYKFSYAQDKLFLRNDSIIQCNVVSIFGSTINYKLLNQKELQKIPKSQAILIEYKSGKICFFNSGIVADVADSLPHIETKSEKNTRELDEFKKKELTYPNNFVGFYPTQLLLGRFTLSYERLFANKSIGINIPLSITFNPGNALRYLATGSTSVSTNTTSTNTTNNNNSNNRNNNEPPPSGIGFIGGFDINYYYDIEPETKYYFGPRIRYGTDILLGSIEGLTFQIQNGIMLTSGKNFATNVGFGVGFFKLSAKYSNFPGYSSKQVYPWMSITWRTCYRF